MRVRLRMIVYRSGRSMIWFGLSGNVIVLMSFVMMMMRRIVRCVWRCVESWLVV